MRVFAASVAVFALCVFGVACGSAVESNDVAGREPGTATAPSQPGDGGEVRGPVEPETKDYPAELYEPGEAVPTTPHPSLGCDVVSMCLPVILDEELALCEGELTERAQAALHRLRGILADGYEESEWEEAFDAYMTVMDDPACAYDE